MYFFKHLLIVVLLLSFNYTLTAKVRISSLFSDNMVIQREAPMTIWGWATAGEKVEVVFNEKMLTCYVNTNNTWELIFPPMKHGGSYNMLIRGQYDSIEIKNIAIGDVWICSGQSNMQHPLQLSHNSENDILQAMFPQIRLLTIPREFSAVPQNDFIGNWEVCSPKSALNFSAIGYYFAKELYENLNIPIGIINVTYGGTDIETWISPETVERLHHKFRYKYNKELLQIFGEQCKPEIDNLHAFLDAMKNDFGIKEKWFEKLNTTSWDSISVPSSWNYTPLSYVDGHIWFKKFFEINNKDNNSLGLLSLGEIEDKTVWINGQHINHTYSDGTHSLYTLSSEYLKNGENEITIRVSDYGLGLGILGNSNDYFVELFDTKGSSLIPLSGSWKYKTSVNSINYNIAEKTPNMHYSSVYNAMINPLIKFPIKGIIWYQGENNVNKADDYKTLFPTLITDWRNKWGYEFPFYWAQLTSYNPIDSLPSNSRWAELREAQTYTLNVPNTGQAITYDLGSQTNIHPPRKREAAERLALIALNKTYKQEVICSSPIYESFEIKDDRIIISMEVFGSELAIRGYYNHLKGFSIAGEDKIFKWAKAYILDNNKLVIYSNEVKHPIAVRYGWEDYIVGNLANKEGLPAAPFRTDTLE